MAIREKENMQKGTENKFLYPEINFFSNQECCIFLDFSENKKKALCNRCVFEKEIKVFDKKCSLPFCVDLDGTLIYGHSLWQLGVDLKMNDFWPLSWPLFKHKIIQRTVIDGAKFSYYTPLLSYLKTRKAQGKPNFLVTGAPLAIALAVEDHVKVFDNVFASTRDKNLVSHTKADFLSRTFKDFSYIGNSWKDLPLWKASTHALCVYHASWALKCFLKIGTRPISFI